MIYMLRQIVPLILIGVVLFFVVGNLGQLRATPLAAEPYILLAGTAFLIALICGFSKRPVMGKAIARIGVLLGVVGVYLLGLAAWFGPAWTTPKILAALPLALLATAYVTIVGVEYLARFIRFVSPNVGAAFTRRCAHFFEHRGKLGYLFSDMIDARREIKHDIAVEGGAHGSARLATDEEAKKNWGQGPVDDQGLAIGGGLVVGKADDDTLLRYDGEGMIILEAGAGQGKGVKAITPTLLLPSTDSRVILDVKGENFQITSRFRRDIGQRVLVLDPGRITDDPIDARINLLTACVPSTGEDIASRAAALANLLKPPPLQRGDNAFFDDLARKLLRGLIVWVAVAPDDILAQNNISRDLMGVRRLMLKNETLLAYISGAILPNLDRVDPLAHPMLEMLGSFNELEAETFSSAPGQASDPLEFLDHAGWRRALCAHDATPANLWRLEDLRKPGFDLYLAVSPPLITAYPAPLNLLIGCVINSLIDAGNLARKPFLMLDEMAQLGRCDPLLKAVEVGRAYCKGLIVLQSRSQTADLYGEKKTDTFYGSVAGHLYLGAGDYPAAKRISELAGKKSILKKSNSAGDKGQAYISGSTTVESKDVILPHEVLRLPDDKIILYRRGLDGAVLNAVKYYSDPRYSGRFDKYTERQEPVETISDDIAGAEPVDEAA